MEKAAVALAMGIACWTMVPHAAGLEMTEALEEMGKAVSDTSQIVFFLLGGMAIVETVDAHKGFSFITDRINTTDKRALVLLVQVLKSQKQWWLYIINILGYRVLRFCAMWAFLLFPSRPHTHTHRQTQTHTHTHTQVGFLTFFLSAVLDNLTTTIVMCSLLGKLVPESYKLSNVLYTLT